MSDINDSNGCHEADSLESNSMIEQENCKIGCATVTTTGKTNGLKVDNIIRGCYTGEDKERNGCVTVDVNVSTGFILQRKFRKMLAPIQQL